MRGEQWSPWCSISKKHMVSPSNTQICLACKLAISRGLIIYPWRSVSPSFSYFPQEILSWCGEKWIKWFVICMLAYICYMHKQLCIWWDLQSIADFFVLMLQVCKIVEGQRYSKRLNDRQITALLKVTCQRPRDREIDIVEVKQFTLLHHLLRDSWVTPEGFMYGV